MNQNTRILYDADATKNRYSISQKPLKYMTNLLTEHRSLNEPKPEDINISNNMRMQPTRLNYFNRPETELYGTAPYKSLGHGQFVDTESSLRHSDYTKLCDRTLTERTWDTTEFINDKLAVDTNLRSRSTRVDLRNEYCKQSSKSFNPNTHTLK